jgi:hypothetical protein
MQRTIQIFTTATGSSSAPALSLEQAIAQARKECLEQDKKIVELSKSTLQRRVTGGKSRKESHEYQSWLTKDEAEIVVSFAIACADQGFPLSHRWLKEYIDQIARPRWGNNFPEDGIGKQWTKDFVSDHSD